MVCGGNKFLTIAPNFFEWMNKCCVINYIIGWDHINTRSRKLFQKAKTVPCFLAFNSKTFELINIWNVKKYGADLAKASRHCRRLYKPENQRRVAGRWNIKFHNLIQDVANSRIINLICMRRHEICVFHLLV